MTEPRLQCCFLGLSITSTWGNGHATTYRALLKYLFQRGHKVTFLERDMPWYAANREFEQLSYCDIALYNSLDELRDRFAQVVRTSDVVVVGSYVPEGVLVGQWVNSISQNITAFYDIDTPVTLANLSNGRCEYLSTELIPQYRLYLSFTGGPTLSFIERKLASPRARVLYCSVDPELYYPEPTPIQWDLAYLGTYAADRQPALERLLLSVARKRPTGSFAVAGPQYPEEIDWPSNVKRIEHLHASEHRRFYNSQLFALNLTRRNMIQAGFSPSVRLFEAAACGVPILTDEWTGLDRFFHSGSEIIPVRTTADVASALSMPAERRLTVVERARRRVLRFHTAAVRANEFEAHIAESMEAVACLKKRSTVELNASTAAALI